MNNSPETSQVPQDFQKYQVEGAYHWAQLRPSFKTTFNPYLLARYQLALKYLPAPTLGRERAADLGCGDGYICGQLRERGYEVDGIDGSELAIKLASDILGKQGKQTPALRLHVGNVLNTGLPSDNVDLVTNLDVIEHVDQPEKLLKEIRRIAKNGATALIGTPVRFTEAPLDRYHVQEFFPGEFRKLLESELTVEAIHFSHPVEWAAMMHKTFPIFGKKKSLGWNLINAYHMITGKNLLAQEHSRFPTYQLAVCSIRK